MICIPSPEHGVLRRRRHCRRGKELWLGLVFPWRQSSLAGRAGRRAGPQELRRPIRGRLNRDIPAGGPVYWGEADIGHQVYSFPPAGPAGGPLFTFRFSPTAPSQGSAGFYYTLQPVVSPTVLPPRGWPAAVTCSLLDRMAATAWHCGEIPSFPNLIAVRLFPIQLTE